MNLIIVESPTKARTLSRFLGRDYTIDPTMGHIVDLPKSKLGVDIEKNFEPDYVLVAKRKDTVAKIKTDAKKAKNIYLATDPDREGEAIAHHVANLINGEKGRVLKRIVFHEITESAVKHALENPRTVDLRLVDAQQARRVLDRLVGYKLSPLLWKKIRKGLSAGRVQSVAVRLVVEKEREIGAFKSGEYWEIFAEVKPPFARASEGQVVRNSFNVKLIKKDSNKIEVANGEQAKEVVSNLEKSSYEVSTVEKKEVVKRPPAPFTTSTMTQAAGRSMYWSAKKTMSVAQKLYEEGLITYHRTDSTNLSVEAIAQAREFIKNKYGQNFVPDSPRLYKTKSKLVQEAHEAIRPTQVSVLSTESQVVSMGNDAIRLYELIWRRFVACQMADSIFDETVINVEAKSDGGIYQMQARGQVMKFEGWKKVYEKTTDYGLKTTAQKKNVVDGSRWNVDEVVLPGVEEGEQLNLIKVTSEQKFTEPPPRYTEATLVKTLEKLGIGRPSTYAPTLTTIQDRQYVEKKEGKFYPTALGIAVNDFLVSYFEGVIDYNFTAQMEDNLDDIAKGEKQWVPVISDFWNPFSTQLEKVEKVAERVKVQVETTGKKCPLCKEGEQIVRVGRFGKFLACSRFPDCKWSAAYVETLQMKCPDCGKGNVVVKRTSKGKHFFGCSRYPKCKWASWRKPAAAGAMADGSGADKAQETT